MKIFKKTDKTHINLSVKFAIILFMKNKVQQVES